MKNFTHLALAIAFAFSMSVGAAQNNSVRFQADDADLIPSSLIDAKSMAAPGSHQETQPLRMSWVLPTDSVITAQQPFVRESKEYWTTVSASALSKGAIIRTTSTGAVVRLSPIGPVQNNLLDPLSVEVRAHGESFLRGKGFANAANVAELNASGAAFSAGTVAFTLKAEVGSGAIEIVLPNARQDYLVHVFEPNSTQVLSLTTDRLIAMHGSMLKVIARMNKGDAVDAIEGSIVSPAGVQSELSFKRQRDGSYVANVRHDGVSGAADGLWEIHAFASGKGGDVQRDARTAIASAAPRAKLAGSGSNQRDRNGALHVKLETQVGASGRYELRGTLYGVDKRTGVVRPAAMAHAAAVLDSGSQSLELVYDAKTMREAGVRAPFQVRELTLIDQSSLSVIELRNAGVALQ